MRASKETIREIENLLMEYEKEVNNALNAGLLTSSTARTYLLHSNNFVRWCGNDFVPGAKNK